jgi:hypothetical protein
MSRIGIDAPLYVAASRSSNEIRSVKAAGERDDARYSQPPLADAKARISMVSRGRGPHVSSCVIRKACLATNLLLNGP